MLFIAVSRAESSLLLVSFIDDVIDAISGSSRY